MHFLIVRKLTNSELGWFGEFRRQGRETSRQRGINFDADVVERVFPTAQSGQDINLSLRFRGDDGIKTEVHPLKRQHKNWRLVGDKIEDKRFGTVDPDDLFLLTIDAIGDTPECAFTIVKPDTDLASFVLAASQTSGLGRNGMIAIHSSESGNLEHHLGFHDPELFGEPEQAATLTAPSDDDGPLRDEDLSQPPEAGRTIEAIASIGHDLNVAVADLIDNSIEAGAQHIEVTFPNPNDHGRILAIIDDGPGMKPRELARKLRIGTSRNYTHSDLGKYGLGLKAASLSQARAVIVASRTADTGIEILGWDKQHVAETGDWNLIRPELDERRTQLLTAALKNRPGTVVLWDDMIPPRNQRQNRKKKAKGEGLSVHGLECLQLARHLGKVFHRFIEGNARGKPQLHLTLNGTAIEALDPLIGWHADTQRLETQSIRIPSGADRPDEIVEIHPVIVPGTTEYENDDEQEKAGFWGKWQESQGFYFYRNDRIIQDGGWCDLWIEDPHFQLLRVAVDLNGKLDHSFGINVAKMTAQPPAFFTTQVKSLLTEARTVAKRRYSPAGRKSQKKARTSPQPAPTPSPTMPSPATPKLPTGIQDGLGGGGDSEAAPPIRLMPLEGRGWRCRTDASGADIVELDASIPQATALFHATAANPEAGKALADMLKTLQSESARQGVLAAWGIADG